jgi:hypothetical protein
MQMSPPNDLYMPIITNRSGEDFLLQPKFPIQPLIDGGHNSFFEWVGCGIVDETKLFSTMDRKRGPIERIRFGQNEKVVYCAFEGDLEVLQHCEKLYITIEPFDTRFEISIPSLFKTKIETMESNQIKLLVACDSWLELSLDFTKMDTQEVQLRFEIERENIIIQTLPGFGELEIILDASYTENWFV